MKPRTPFLLFLSLVTFLFTWEASARKLKPKQLIALHLKSIGENPARQNRMAQGSGHLDIRVGGTGQMAGPAVWVSEAGKVRSSIRFGHVHYHEELLVYDGKHVDIAQIAPGVRSQLGQSIWAHFQETIPEGLYGGVLSTEWALLGVDERRPKLKYKGLKKFEDRELHELEYKPKKGVDYRIALFFEPETHRHLASSYRLILPSGRMRPINNLGRGPGSTQPRSPGDGPTEDFPESRDRITLLERFEDFKEVDGLSLPHTHRVTINFDQFRGSFVGHWEMKFDRILHDQKIDPKVFTSK